MKNCTKVVKMNFPAQICMLDLNERRMCYQINKIEKKSTGTKGKNCFSHKKNVIQIKLKQMLHRNA